MITEVQKPSFKLANSPARQLISFCVFYGNKNKGSSFTAKA
jgi:hypothetical protein